MFNDVVPPSEVPIYLRFTEDDAQWVNWFLERRQKRLETWDRPKYLAVLEDLYRRLAPKHWKVWFDAISKAPLVDLDMYVVNMTVLAIRLDLLQPPVEMPGLNANLP